MYFCHSEEIWNDYPQLVPGVLAIEGITPDPAVDVGLEKFDAVARSRLAQQSESDLPEIQAWRRVFARMGLKPTQYRCASEALLRRFRKEGRLPRIHPLIDICNATSLAFAIPVAVFDTTKIVDHLEVRYATGTEKYQSFSGETEHPASGEVVFADGGNNAHARRWTNRQSARSAVQASSASVLIVAEAVHDAARADIERLVDTLAERLTAVWAVTPTTALLTRDSPRFEVG